MTKVVPIRTGIGNSFLVIQNNKFFLVDTGQKGYENKIASAITSHGLKLDELQFIFLTHTHYDHAGSASAVKHKSAAKIIVHKSEVDYLEQGFHPMPKGISPFFKFIINLGKLRSKSSMLVKTVKPDITFTNSFDLQQMGFNAKITHTPGHTKGSSCLIIDKYAFVGDTIFNVFGNIFPPFANDTQQLINSWKLLLDTDVDYYYPAHGKRITKDKFKIIALKKIL